MGQGPCVKTRSGIVRGIQGPAGAAFLGIPYAQAPCGDRRFLAPVAPERWDGIRNACAFGPTPQRVTLAEITTIPEPSLPGADTLSVNVWTPDPSRTARLPVLVWIHGGGYVAGSPASPWYDGRSFARDGVVFVSISYRLGFDGFGWIPDAPANRGVLDWLCALTWVQENIAGFGGDPDRVTIAGQSAGGGAVMTLLTMPRAQGLFRAAVSASGVPADIDLARARTVAQSMAQALKVSSDRAGFASIDEADVIAAQPSLEDDWDSPSALGVAREIDGYRGALPLGPVVDGEIVEQPVDEALSTWGSSVPLLAGATTGEFASALDSRADDLDTLDAEEALVSAGLSGRRARELIEAEPEARVHGLLSEVMTQRMFRDRLGRWVMRRGHGPTWIYDFGWNGGPTGAAEHCSDVPFWFDLLDAPGVRRVLGDQPPRALADEMHGALVAFISDLTPGWASADGDPGASKSWGEGARGYAFSTEE